MQHTKKSRVILINLLTAAAISMVVNFFYFVNIIATYSSGGDPSQMWQNPHMQGWYISIQMVYFMLFAFILLSVVSTARFGSRKGASNFMLRLVVCASIALVFFFLAPRLVRGGELAGELVFNFERQPRRILDPTLILQCALTLVVVMLYDKILELIYQKQNIQLENEVLKNENLQATYNSLVNQTNPHFFFNSLNSLAMLVREKHNDKALEYIDRLSDSFRYILQNGQIDMTTLDEELKFLEDYTYMLDIRYDGKIFFNTEVDPQYRTWQLPSLSLQPLIENAVKHNTITRSKPLHISIRTVNDAVVVSNEISPKIDKPHGAGIGLNNLSARYNLLTGRKITIRNEGQMFEVTLPLKPAKP